ncbi:hypothetical protein FPRO06_12884 [Fusarium proliferatum]|uniref:DUF1479 domain protein n=1 Tax=Gibberella intermedia TaxID=948311 RepID=A0A365NNZ6_GIBIN|nr:hypothetical protein FPRO06_12884 [Fusarium proliferatum]RBA22554.1 hypothetical protein FPRO05_00901 [Fusarium proliferatum]
MSYTETEQLELSQQLLLDSCNLLDQRFAALKKSLVKPENKQKVIESYERLVKILRKEVDHIDKHGAALVPEIDFDDVRKNGGKLPDDFTKLVHERGCIILRNVVSEEQAVSWETSLKDYTKRHPGVGGHPHHKPAAWNVFWTKAQMEMRTHPRVLEAMRCVSRLWHVSDPTIPIDLDSQVIYPDRIRIRYPSNDPGQFPLDPHMDSGAIERWEDDENRKNYAAIFEGNWQDWDAWSADHRVTAQSDLYHTGTACSVWRSLQGWLSLSNTQTGEGTLRVLPSLKLSMAYIMLRPLFHTGEYNDSLPTFPGATPGQTQFFPTVEGHPDLDIKRAIVGIPPVRPGDYVFWHCDLVHGVDPTNPGLVDSSVSYNACNPLTPYNIESLLTTRDAFQKGDVPIDFTRSHGTWEREYDHEDCGARVENILTKAGLQAMGLERLDTEEEGLTQGQKEVREMANGKLGL